MNKPFLGVTLFAYSLSIAITCGASAWYKYQGNLYNNGRAPADGAKGTVKLIGPKPGQTGAIVQPGPIAIWDNPANSDWKETRLIAGSSDPRLFAIKPDNGFLVWSQLPPDSDEGYFRLYPAVDALNERIFAVDQIASTVMAFGVDGSNGPFWKYKIQEIGGEYQPLSSPAPWGDVVFVTKYKTLYALKANPRKYLGPGDKVGPPPINGVDQGIVLWSADLPERVQANGSPAVSTGTDPCVLVVGATGTVVKAHAVFHPPDGKRNIWTNSINAHVFKPAAIGSDGRIFIPANNGRMYCMDSDGKLLWSAPPVPHSPHETFLVENTSAPAIGLQNGNDLVYFTVRQQLFAINGLTGATVWSLALDQLPASDPVVTPNQTIYLGVGSEERGQVIAVRAKPRPNVAGGGVAMVPEIVWSASIGSRPNYLAVGDNGFIYVSTDSTLFRIE